MVVTLYYMPGACSLAVHAALKFAKVPCNLVKVNGADKTTEDGADFKSINPTGAVPALKLEDGQVLTQNLAIQYYIGATSKYPSFNFADALKEARLLEALAKCGDLHTGVAGHVFGGAGPEYYTRRMSEFEAWIPAEGWILGTEEPSQADFYTAVIVSWTAFKKLDISDYPKLAAFQKKVFSLPAFVECLKEEGLA